MTIDFETLNLTILLGTIGICLMVVKNKNKSRVRYSEKYDLAKAEIVQQELQWIAMLIVISACALITSNILKYPLNVIAWLIFIVIYVMVIYNLYSRKKNRIKAERD